MNFVVAVLSFRAHLRAHPIHQVLVVGDVFAADLAAIVYNYFHPVRLQLHHELTSFMCCGPGYLAHTLEVGRANEEQVTTSSASVADVTGAGVATITDLEDRASTIDTMHLRIIVDRSKKKDMVLLRRGIGDDTVKNST